jgi:cell division protein FtsA
VSTDNYILGLDLGTNKVAALLGRWHGGHLSLCSLGLAPSEGVRRGEIVDLEKVSGSIRAALGNLRPATKAQPEEETPPLLALPKVPSRAWIGITGDHVQCFNAYAGLNITKPGRPVNSKDVEEVMRQAVNSLALPAGHEVIHVIARAFSVQLREKENDGNPPSGSGVLKPMPALNQRGAAPAKTDTVRNNIPNPVGMPASRLEVQAHIVSASVIALGHLENCLEQVGLNVDGVVLQPLASADAVLSDAERELGVALLDIGAGTTDIAIFMEGAVCYTGSLAMGGSHITRDLAVGLEIDSEEAEKLKITQGCAWLEAVPPETKITLKTLSSDIPKTVSGAFVAEIIQARMAEILSLAKEQMLRSGFFHRLAVGVVITGGGSQLNELPLLARQVLGLPVRLGRPMAKGPASFKNPALATGVGLLLYGAQEQFNAPPATWHQVKPTLVARLISWCKSIFGP